MGASLRRSCQPPRRLPPPVRRRRRTDAHLFMSCPGGWVALLVLLLLLGRPSPQLSLTHNWCRSSSSASLSLVESCCSCCRLRHQTEALTHRRQGAPRALHALPGILRPASETREASRAPLWASPLPLRPRCHLPVAPPARRRPPQRPRHRAPPQPQGRAASPQPGPRLGPLPRLRQVLSTRLLLRPVWPPPPGASDAHRRRPASGIALKKQPRSL